MCVARSFFCLIELVELGETMETQQRGLPYAFPPFTVNTMCGLKEMGWPFSDRREKDTSNLQLSRSPGEHSCSSKCRMLCLNKLTSVSGLVSLVLHPRPPFSVCFDIMLFVWKALAFVNS